MVRTSSINSDSGQIQEKDNIIQESIITNFNLETNSTYVIKVSVKVEKLNFYPIFNVFRQQVMLSIEQIRIFLRELILLDIKKVSHLQTQSRRSILCIHFTMHKENNSIITMRMGI